jgi:peptidoglycan hydrolase-like protein with peptidoglycan-binding domain
MQRTLTATAILFALSIPAFAQCTTTSPAPAQPEAAQSQNAQPQATSPDAGTQATIDHTTLSQDEIRKIQNELNNAGFDPKGVDGVWGPDTRAALQDYQQQQNLPGNGELNQPTLSALGVEVASGQATGSAATGAGEGTAGTAAPPAVQQDRPAQEGPRQ